MAWVRYCEYPAARSSSGTLTSAPPTTKSPLSAPARDPISICTGAESGESRSPSPRCPNQTSTASTIKNAPKPRCNIRSLTYRTIWEDASPSAVLQAVMIRPSRTRKSFFRAQISKVTLALARAITNAVPCDSCWVKPNPAVSNRDRNQSAFDREQSAGEAHHPSETDEENNLREAHADYLSSTTKC